LTRVYDTLGRLTSYTDGAGNVVGYQYDALNQLALLTYPGGKQVGYAYDSAGRLSTVTDWANRVTAYSYDPDGRMTQVLRPNGTKQVRTYDLAGQLTQLRDYAPDGMTIIYSATYWFDMAGQLTAADLNPATTAVTSNVVQTFDQDDRLLTQNGNAATVDADGNLLSIASGVTPSSYAYDARNRLTSAGGINYEYNSENRRISLTDSTGTTHFVINPNALLDQVLVRTAPDGTQTFYVYGLGLLHEESGSVARFYHYDQRGDTVALSNSTGSVTGTAAYGVYGEIVSQTGSTNTPFLFNGNLGVQTDSNGLYFHRARYYHPSLRRWLNADPIGLPGGLNLYAYVGNNPISRIDPFGLVWYNPASWNWTEIGSGVQVKGGIGPGFGTDIQLGPLELKADASVTTVGGYFDLSGGIGNYQSAEASLDVGFKSASFGYKNGYEVKSGVDGCHKATFEETKPDAGDAKWGFHKGEGDSSNPYQVGATGDLFFGRVGVTVDLKKIWQGITQ
jgi:RHS repeat-associated protein